jgi:hypothetical protein
MSLVAFSPISGQQHTGRYDGQHITAVPRRTAQSVTPNLLRDLKPFIDLDDELDEEELLRLLTQDGVELSEEARDILRKIKKRKKRGRERDAEQSEEEFLQLLAQLDEQDAVPVADLPRNDITPLLPPVLTMARQAPRPEGSFLTPPSPPPPRPSRPVRPARAQEEDDISSLSRAGKLGLAMVAMAPSKHAAMKVARDLESFSSEVLAEVKRFGTRFVVVEPHQAFTEVKIGGMYLFGAGEKTADGRPWSVVRGVYSSKRRMICIGEEQLDESSRTGRSTVRHEFAHAYEHYWSDKRQRRQPLSVELWYRFEKTRTAFVTAYASTQPAEYFAESVEAFFAPSLREHLRHGDPEMFAYLAELFGGGLY